MPIPHESFPTPHSRATLQGHFKGCFHRLNGRSHRITATRYVAQPRQNGSAPPHKPVMLTYLIALLVLPFVFMTGLIFVLRLLSGLYR